MFWSLFFIRLQAFKACNFIKKRLQNRCFPVCEISKNTYFKERFRTTAFRTMPYESNMKTCTNLVALDVFIGTLGTFQILLKTQTDSGVVDVKMG